MDSIQNKTLSNIILITCIIIFAFSLYSIANRLYGYKIAQKHYAELKSQVNSVSRFDAFSDNTILNSDSISSDTNSMSVLQSTPPSYKIDEGNPAELGSNGILSDYTKLKTLNNDMIGWIFMPGFQNPIDYPIMQAGDNDFYLKKDFYGNYSYAGSIFMDMLNNAHIVDRHIIIYGHAMRDFSMFGNLMDYPKKPDDYKKFTKIYIDLMNTRLEYEVFSTYLENASYNYRQISFVNDDEYLEFLERIRSKSVYDYGVKLTAKDKIITLSTCNNSLFGDGRTIIHAKLLRQIVYTPENSMDKENKFSEPTIKNAVSANVYLMKLSMTYGPVGNPEEAEFEPPFDTVQREFTSHVPGNVEEVSLEVQTADPEAWIEIFVNDQKLDPQHLRLDSGENIIRVRVFSRDSKYERTYSIKVVREIIK